MASLFISYSRKDIDTARRLTAALKDQDLDFWIDWEGIPPTVDWWKEIEKGIEEADIFLFLMSIYSCQSSVCQREIEHAAQNGKRLVPVVVRDLRADEAPQALRHLNWIFLREADDFDQAFRKLITAIQTDYTWAQTHRELQVKALEWERASRRNDFLLRGEELREAELQLVANTSKVPHPTELQREYVLGSRLATDRQRRRTTGVAIAVAIVMGVLAVFGFVQARLALQRATLSLARELAAQSVAFRDSELDLSLLFAIEALRTADLPRTRTVLLDSTQARPELSQYLHGTSVALSPDGKTLAYGMADGSIYFWDMDTRQIAGESLTGHTTRVWSIVFSPDGETLASSSVDDAIFLWDVATRQSISQPILADSGVVTMILFSPDGKLLASSSYDDTITLWDVSAVRETDKGPVPALGDPLIANTDGVTALAFSPDGKFLASSGWTGSILLWDLATWEPIGEPLLGHTEPVNAVVFSPDGKTVASGGDDNTILLWDVSTVLDGSEESGPISSRPLRSQIGVIYSLAFSSDGTILASASSDRTVIMWDIETGQTVGQPLLGHVDQVFSVAFGPDDLTLVSHGGDDAILVWDMSIPPPIGQPLLGHTASVSTVALTRDSALLASGSCRKSAENRDCLQREIILWDAKAGQAIGKPLLVHTGVFASIAFSPDGKLLASAGCGEHVRNAEIDRYECVRGEILLWEVSALKSTNMETSRAPAPQRLETEGPLYSIAFSHDGSLLASASCAEQVLDTDFQPFYNCIQGEIILWDLGTGKAMGQPITESSGRVANVAFSPDGKTLAAANWDFKIILWDVETREPIGQPLEGHSGSVDTVVFSPDGKLLASNAADGSVRLWDVATHAQIGEPLKGFAVGSSATNVAFSPDGTTLASSSSDSTILLWDVAMQQLISQPLNGHSGAVRHVAFSSDGNLLASSSDDATVILWDLDIQSWIKISCQRAGRNFTQAEWAQFFPDQEYRQTCPQWPSGE